MRIGFIGTGVMGSRMITRLLDNGYPVTVYNRTVEKTHKLLELGATQALSISELASQSDVVCTSLSMPEDVRSVYSGATGLLEHMKPNGICIDLTSVDPDTSRFIFELASKKDIAYLDSPVSGGPESAETGTLTLMIGGEKKAYESVLPILKVFGKTIEYLGPSGSGSIAKLMNQYLVAVHSLAVSEVMVAATAYSLDPEQLYKVLKESYGDSRILQRHLSNFILKRQFEPGGAVKYVHKDVRLANQLLGEIGIQNSTGQFAEEAFKKAMDQGLSELDMSAVIQTIEQQCGVVVKGTSLK